MAGKIHYCAETDKNMLDGPKCRMLAAYVRQPRTSWTKVGGFCTVCHAFYPLEERLRLRRIGVEAAKAIVVSENTDNGLFAKTNDGFGSCS